MKVHRFAIMLAAVALLGLGATTSQAGARRWSNWRAQEGRRHSQRVEYVCCYRCCDGGMGWRACGHRMDGNREMRGSRSFGAASFDGWLGIETQKSDRGDLTVTKVLPGSPADKAGVQPNDIVTSVNGVSLVSSERPALGSLVSRGFAEGKQVTVTVLRAGKVMPLDVTLQAAPRKASGTAPSGMEKSEPAPMTH